eukprot:TRINITY_DN9268_c0_g1_i2.p1 TRINITY_DN9268_c0_g1~~TRINITY_DN9268_c0_g1_i2.p1  ORF type:complete len:710 (+),score=59.13 TRINITY_DN9268_c0_g1_i2:29-2131(+)
MLMVPTILCDGFAPPRALLHLEGANLRFGRLSPKRPFAHSKTTCCLHTWCCRVTTAASVSAAAYGRRRRDYPDAEISRSLPEDVHPRVKRFLYHNPELDEQAVRRLLGASQAVQLAVIAKGGMNRRVRNPSYVLMSRILNEEDFESAGPPQSGGFTVQGGWHPRKRDLSTLEKEPRRSRLMDASREEPGRVRSWRAESFPDQRRTAETEVSWNSSPAFQPPRRDPQSSEEDPPRSRRTGRDPWNSEEDRRRDPSSSEEDPRQSRRIGRIPWSSAEDRRRDPSSSEDDQRRSRRTGRNRRSSEEDHRRDPSSSEEDPRQSRRIGRNLWTSAEDHRRDPWNSEEDQRRSRRIGRNPWSSEEDHRRDPSSSEEDPRRSRRTGRNPWTLAEDHRRDLSSSEDDSWRSGRTGRNPWSSEEDPRRSRHTDDSRLKPERASSQRLSAQDERDDFALDILLEDDEVLVVNKAAGILSMANEPGEHSLCSVARVHLSQGRPRSEPFVGLVHRLDSDVTGAIVIGKTKEAASWLSRQFAQRTVKKEYIAVVRRWEHEGVQVLKNIMETDDFGQAHEAPKGSDASQKASLQCRKLWSAPSGATALLVRLHTGRRHQIRYQLAAAGSPLLGDKRYGNGKGDGSRRWVQRPALHSWRLQFEHPEAPHSACEVLAPLPADLVALMKAIGIPPQEVLAEASKGFEKDVQIDSEIM